MRVDLKKEIERAGIFAGLLCLNEKGKPDGVNNSTLSNVKKILLGQPLFKGGENFLRVGSELHRRQLQPNEPEYNLSIVEEAVVSGMDRSLASYKPLQKLLKGAEKEILLRATIYGTPVRGTLDIRKRKAGGDLKTSACSTEFEFYKKAIEYDYPRQAQMYKKIAGLNSFVFFGVQKKYPYQVYEMNMGDFPREMKEAELELEFLIYVYKNYILKK